MSLTGTGARAWALLASLLFAAVAGAQTMEIFAGGGRFVDIPGNTIGFQPGALAIAADGYLYTNDINGKLMRLNLATGLVTALPATSGGLNYNIGYSYGIAVDVDGHAQVWSNGNLQRIEADGTLTTLGSMPYGGPIAFGPDGTVYAVPGDSRVYARRPSGEVEIVAGLEDAGFGGDGGPAVNALLNAPQGVAVAANGDVYISDTGNFRVRKINASTGVITTVAGTGFSGFNGNGLPAIQTNIGHPQGLAFDATGNLLVAAQDAGRILRVNAASLLVSTIAGGGNGGDGGPAIGARMTPRLIAVAPNGDVYLSDWGTSYQKVRKIDASTGIISLAIGFDSFYFCGEDVPARFACLAQPYALDIDAAGNLFIGDISNTRIREVSAGNGHITTFQVTTDAPLGIEHDATGNIFVASYGNYQVNRYDAITGAKSVVAGGNGYGFSGDGGPATLARLAAPNDVAIDATGNLFIADSGNNRVRRVDAATGIINTYATGFNSPGALDFDAAGDLIVSDRSNCLLKKISTATGAVTTIAGTGTCVSTAPPGGAAASATPIGRNASFAIASNGEIFLGWQSPIIFRIDPVTGVMARVAAPATGLATPEGKHIGNAAKMEFDAAGSLYISQDTFPNEFIFRVSGLFDTTPPIVDANVAGTAGDGGWYRSNVTVNWVVSDAESTVTATSGCTTSAVSEDTDGITFTCSATSAGGTTTKALTIRRDTIAPTLTFGAALPAADAAGWNQGDVSIGFTVNDDRSGVYSTSTGNPILFSDSGSGLSREVTVTDFAGNSASFTTPLVNIDRAPPLIEVNVAGPAGNDGWYLGNVSVSWTVTGSSEITARNGCDPTMVGTDTAGTTFTCTATSHGGSASRSVTVKRDATAPTLSFGALSPAPNANGWNNSAVTIPYTAEDATSGVISAEPAGPLQFDSDGVNLFAQVHVVDGAGNAANFDSPHVNIDRSPPVLQPAVAGTLGNNGWYTSDVQISWNIDEVAGDIISSSGCNPASVAADTAGTAFTCSVTSAGGTTSSSVTIKRDATPPLLSFGTPTPAPNAHGWNKTDVKIPFTRSDALSGLASTSTTSPLIISTEGANVTGQVVVTDNAGNSATFTSVPRNVDKTAPVLTFPSPEDGSHFGFYQNAFANYSCDDVSLVSCTAAIAEGDYLTKTGGSRSLKVTAKDSVGFTTTETHYFYVEPYFNWTGFQAPGNDPPTLNLVTRGEIIPIRWQLADGEGDWVSNPASMVSATVTTISCGSAAVVAYPETAGGPVGLSYDYATGTFTYKWATNASWTGCRKLTIKLKDSTTHEMRFKFQ